MILRTKVRDCLYLNWAVPADATPPVPEPLRLQRSFDGRTDWGFASALLFHHEGLRFRALPFVRVSSPQLHLRYYVVDGDGRPAVYLRRTFVPLWLTPALRLLGGHPALPARMLFARPSQRSGARALALAGARPQGARRGRGARRAASRRRTGSRHLGRDGPVLPRPPPRVHRPPEAACAGSTPSSRRRRSGPCGSTSGTTRWCAAVSVAPRRASRAPLRLALPGDADDLRAQHPARVGGAGAPERPRCRLSRAPPGAAATAWPGQARTGGGGPFAILRRP